MEIPLLRSFKYNTYSLYKSKKSCIFNNATHYWNSSQSDGFFSSLEETILTENPVRFVDAFVEYINFIKLVFSVQTLKKKVARVMIAKYF